MRWGWSWLMLHQQKGTAASRSCVTTFLRSTTKAEVQPCDLQFTRQNVNRVSRFIDCLSYLFVSLKNRSDRQQSETEAPTRNMATAAFVPGTAGNNAFKVRKTPLNPDEIFIDATAGQGKASGSANVEYCCSKRCATWNNTGDRWKFANTCQI